MQEFIFVSEAKLKYMEDKEYKADFRNATLCALLANINRDTDKKKEPFTVEDFMPIKKVEDKPKEPKKPIDVNIMAEMFYALTESCGGVVDR